MNEVEWIHNMTYWHWWVAGLILVILEVFSPAAFFLWMGISAGVVGLLLLIWPDMAWQYQIMGFAIFSVGSIVAGRSYLRKNPLKTDQPALNRRGEQYIGRSFTLSEPIVNGVGKISVDDTTWKVAGQDCAEGTQVIVTDVDGVVFQVKPL